MVASSEPSSFEGLLPPGVKVGPSDERTSAGEIDRVLSMARLVLINGRPGR